MHWLNDLNSCESFLKIYENPEVSEYIDDKIKAVSKKMQTDFINADCKSDEHYMEKVIQTDEYINDMKRKLINYYKYLCVNQYLEKVNTTQETLKTSNNVSENVYYLELPERIQEMSEITPQLDTGVINYKNRENLFFYMSHGFVCLGRLTESTNISEFLDNIKKGCISRLYPEIIDDEIKINLWKVKAEPPEPRTIEEAEQYIPKSEHPKSNGGKRKSKRNKKTQRKRKTNKKSSKKSRKNNKKTRRCAKK